MLNKLFMVLKKENKPKTYSQKIILRIPILILIILLSIICKAQISKLDSLKLATYKVKGELKSKSLNRLAMKYAFNDFDSALHYIHQSIHYSKTHHFDSLYIEAINIKGIIYDIQGNYDSSEFYFLKTYKLSIDKKFQTYEKFSINNLGMMYWRKGEFNMALTYFFKTLKLSEAQNNKDLISLAYNNIGLIYQEMKQYKKALEYHKKTLDLRIKMKSEDNLPSSFTNLGICYENLNMNDSAKYFYKKSIEYAKKTSNQLEEGVALSNLGSLYYKLEDYHNAEYTLLRSLKIQGIGQNTILSDNLNLSGIYFALKQYKQGIKHGLIAKEIIEKTNNLTKAQNVYKHLALNYAALGNNELSIKYLSRWEELTDSIFSEYNANAINKLEIEYQTEKKEKALIKEQAENERLAKEKALAEIRISNRNIWIITISGMALIAVLILLFLNQRNRRKAQSEKDAAIIKEREKGIKAIIQATEDERKRIAKDLHDGIGQQISGLKMLFQQLKHKIDEEEFDKINQELEETGTEVRNISHQMMPRSLQELGLITALDYMLEKSFFNSGIQYKFDQFGIEERLSEEIEITVYRISQELVNNIIKHSGATEVSFQIMNRKGYLILIVEDDGKGFSDEEIKNGIGILNMKSRLNVVNGELEFDKNSEKGTIATIRIRL